MSIENICLYKGQTFDGNRSTFTTDMFVVLTEGHCSQDDTFDFFSLDLADLMRIHRTIANLIKTEEQYQANEGCTP